MAEQNPFESGEYDIPEQNPFESGEYDIPEQNPFDSDEDDMAEQNQTVGTEVTGEEGIDAEESIGLGGFLRSLSTPAAETPVDTFARDLSAGHVILVDDRPWEITEKRVDTMVSSRASQPKITLSLVNLFNKAHRNPVVARATDKMKCVTVARVRYTIVGAPVSIISPFFRFRWKRRGGHGPADCSQRSASTDRTWSTSI